MIADITAVYARLQAAAVFRRMPLNLKWELSDAGTWQFPMTGNPRPLKLAWNRIVLPGGCHYEARENAPFSPTLKRDTTLFLLHFLGLKENIWKVRSVRRSDYRRPP